MLLLQSRYVETFLRAGRRAVKATRIEGRHPTVRGSTVSFPKLTRIQSDTRVTGRRASFMIVDKPLERHDNLGEQ